MKHKTAELEGALLDAAVAKAEGLQWRVFDPELRPLGSPHSMVYLKDGPTDGGQGGGYPLPYDPSKNWQHGGPILEREQICLQSPDLIQQDVGAGQWWAGIPGSGMGGMVTGSTPLIAAMRAFCASRFGAEVELP